MKSGLTKNELLLEISKNAVEVANLKSSATRLSALIDQIGEAEERLRVARLEATRKELVLKALAKPSPRAIKILGALAWFYGPESRSDAEATIRDLSIDRREMIAEGRAAGFVWAAVTWRVVWFILRTSADGVWRIARPKGAKTQ